MKEKKINLLEILSYKETYEEDCNSVSVEDALSAMEDACKQILTLAAEKIKSDALEDFGTDIPDCWNEDSITNTINLVEKGC